MAISIARVTFSPTTAPMVPAMETELHRGYITGRPFSRPSAVTMASAHAESRWALRSRVHRDACR